MILSETPTGILSENLPRVPLVTALEIPSLNFQWFFQKFLQRFLKKSIGFFKKSLQGSVEVHLKHFFRNFLIEVFWKCTGISSETILNNIPPLMFPSREVHAYRRHFQLSTYWLDLIRNVLYLAMCKNSRQLIWNWLTHDRKVAQNTFKKSSESSSRNFSGASFKKSNRNFPQGFFGRPSIIFIRCSSIDFFRWFSMDYFKDPSRDSFKTSFEKLKLVPAIPLEFLCINLFRSRLWIASNSCKKTSRDFS